MHPTEVKPYMGGRTLSCLSGFRHRSELAGAVAEIERISSIFNENCLPAACEYFALPLTNRSDMSGTEHIPRMVVCQHR